MKQKEALERLAEKGINTDVFNYQGTPNPTKAVCNNCDATASYDIASSPVALLLTISDSLGSEVFYCPNCGPIDEDSLDSVTIE